MNRFAGLLAAASLGCVSLAHAGLNEFTITGPDGGQIVAIAVQPGNPNVVIAASNSRRFRSTDAGMSWTDITPLVPRASRFMAFDPGQPNRLYLVGSQVYVSNDAGATFTATTSIAPADYPSVFTAGTGALYFTASTGLTRRTTDGGQTWTTLTVPWITGVGDGFAAAPGNGAVIYACADRRTTYKSTNAGDTWTDLGPGSPCAVANNSAYHVAVSPFDANHVLMATSEGLYLSLNGGTSWSQVTTSPLIQWTTFDPAVANHVFSVELTGRAVRSIDGGVTWQGGATILLDRTEGAAYSGTAGHVWLATPDGPMFSTDNGGTLTLRTGGMHASNVHTVAAADDGAIYAMQTAGRTGLYRRGTSAWTRLDTDELLAAKQSPLDLWYLDVAPQNSSVVYLSEQGTGLRRSANGGMDWTSPPPSLPGTVSAVRVDPTNSSVVYAARGSNGLYRSTNGGASYTACGFPASTYLSQITVDRAAPTTLYALGLPSPPRRIYRSVNSCASWTQLTTSFIEIYDLAVDPSDNQVLYAAHVEGLARSSDGGATWQTLNFRGDGNTAIGAAYRVLLDPVYPDTVWALGAGLTGAARSVDGGASWQRMDSPWIQTNGSNGVLDPLSPDTLVAGLQGIGLAEFTAGIDLQAAVTAPAPAPAGALGNAVITVSNLGTLDASPAEFTLTLPAFVTAPNLPAGCTAGAGAVRCLTPIIRHGASVSVTLALSSSGPGAGNLGVTVVGHETDPVAANNSASARVASPPVADIAVQMPAAPPPGFTRGDSRELVFTVSNRGPDAAENTRAAFTAGTGLTLASVTPSAGNCVTSGQLATCTFGILALDAERTVRVQISANAPGTLLLDVDVASDALDGNTNHSGRLFFVVSPAADLSIEGSTAAGTRNTNTPFTYAVIVRNAGPDAAQSTASFTLTGATLTELTTTAGICSVASAGGASCQLNGLASGASATITVTANAAAAGTATLTADIAPVGAVDAGAANNRSVTNATVVAPTPPAGSSSGGASSGSGGGGGGGRFDGFWLLALAGLAAAQVARRPRRG